MSDLVENVDRENEIEIRKCCHKVWTTDKPTSAPDGVGWLMPHPGRFTPRKETWYPLYRRLFRPWDWSGWVGKILTPTRV